MALTAEQETEILTRLGAGEGPNQVIRGMSIARSDFMAFRKSRLQDVVDARNSKTARLARLNREKADLEYAKELAESRLELVEEQITAVEAEEE